MTTEDKRAEGIMKNGAVPESSASTEDLGAADGRRRLLVPDPVNRSAYLKMKEATPARLGIWRCGPRYLTEPSLRFRADHAMARDAVLREVAENFFGPHNFFEIRTRCSDRQEYLTRPDLGRRLADEAMERLRERCRLQPQVQLYIADGLSSVAVERNALDAYLAIEQGLAARQVELGTPFFLRYGRVGSMEPVSVDLQAEVTAVLIGERPGLATAESLSCYLAYRARPGMSESERTVISNIHRNGTPAVEAGAVIADVICAVLAQRVSGLDLRL